MTYDVYAMYKDGSYLVASGNDSAHTEAVAERVMRELSEYPPAIATLIRGEHVIRGPIYSMEDLKTRRAV
jgi:hypothetical protein